MDIIESKYRHDFRFCKCGRVAVDGGKDYLKRTFKESPDDYTDLSRFVTTDETKELFGE